jgi:hypothetical protein
LHQVFSRDWGTAMPYYRQAEAKQTPEEKQ